MDADYVELHDSEEEIAGVAHVAATAATHAPNSLSRRQMRASAATHDKYPGASPYGHHDCPLHQHPAAKQHHKSRSPARAEAASTELSQARMKLGDCGTKRKAAR